MPELPRPYEIYEWSDNKTETWTVLSWEVGDLKIQPRDGREAKEIQVLRIHVPLGEKANEPRYWDLTSARLVAQLKSLLPPSGIGTPRVTITAIGAAPRTHFSVSLVPAKLG